MTLIDMNGSYGRSDGGIGLTLAEPNFILKLEESNEGITIDFDKEYSEDIKNEAIRKIKLATERLLKYFDVDCGLHFTVLNTYPNHSGLGSGTQISLATAKLVYDLLIKKSLISKPFKKDEETIKLAEILKRGGTSGIGIFSFDYGGFIVEGGHDLKEKGTILPSDEFPAKPPQLIGSYEFPEEWDIIVVIPEGDTSITGAKEDETFAANLPIPKNDAEKLSHLILMNLIPFMLEKNIESFGKTIHQIQELGFKKVEVSLHPKNIHDAMDKLREFGAHGVGMSSFGPGFYGFTCGNTQEVYTAIKDYIGDDGTVFVTKAQNHGREFL
jgi:beta-ribofuranosylaminobenzene 5'-phosphate synthase